METLTEAKQYLHDNWIEGVECPCCGQNVKLYKRSIHPSMAYALIKFYGYSCKYGFGKYYFLQAAVGEKANMIADFSKLRHWGLVVHKNEMREDGSRRNGYFMITTKEIDFVNKNLKVPKYVYLYNNIEVNNKDTGGLVGIEDCLGSKFNYSDLTVGMPIVHNSPQLKF